MYNQKRLTNIFKTFINTVILPTFRANEPIYQEWNYFSNIISQQILDYKMLEVYVDVLVKSGPQTFYHNNGVNTTNNNAFKLDMDRIKTNSMLYNQKIENQGFNYEPGFQLNKTVGASDRSKFTAMFPTKSTNPSFSLEGGTKLVSKTSIKTIEQPNAIVSVNMNTTLNTTSNSNLSSSPNSILSQMEKIYKNLSENQLKLEGNSLQLNNGGGSYYKFKEDRRP